MVASVSISPLAKQQFNQLGVPLAGGKLFTYISGTTTKQTTYNSATGATPNTNPIILDSNGQCDLWLVNNEIYTFVLSPATDTDPPTNPFWTVDGITGTGGLATSTVANIAALRALATTSPSAVYVNGYYTAADGGEGEFVYVSTDTTSSDNGGTIIVDAINRRWYRGSLGDAFSIRQFGAKGNGTTDDTTAIQNCITAAGVKGFKVLINAGWFLVSSTLTSTVPITIEGVGSGIGPGVLDDVLNSCSVILCAPAFTTGNVFTVTTLFSCIFRDFQIAGALSLGFQSACPRTNGAGINIIGPTGHVNCGSIINNVAFSGLFTGIILTRCNEDVKVTNTYHQAWGNSGWAIYADNGNTAIECSMGILSANQFFGNPAATQTACVEAHCGYGSFTRNKCLGSQTGLIVYANQTVSIGNVIIDDNSFEENTVQSILLTQNGTVAIAGFKITNNQFSNIAQSNLQNHIAVFPQAGGSQVYLYGGIITGNTFTSLSNGTPGGCININCYSTIVANNTMNVIGGTMYAVIVALNSGVIQVLDNTIYANGGALAGTTGYLFSALTVLRDTLSRTFTFALLPANADNGSEIYVTNGKSTNFLAGNLTVTNGGTGCIAWRMSSAWLTIQT